MFSELPLPKPQPKQKGSLLENTVGINTTLLSSTFLIQILKHVTSIHAQTGQKSPQKDETNSNNTR